ncbi:MAG: Uma2 family endonuclease [Spirulinaceae cyanobacterium]
MVQTPLKPQQTLYPDSDGKPMAENTEQYQWITRLVTNLKHLLREQTAFVAGDLLWYPVQVESGETPPSQAPDAMVALGRLPGKRGSYRQWEEAGIAPQVVFEILSPSNTTGEMFAKQMFYTEHGVLEMYFYDPESYEFWGLVRERAADAPEPVMRLNLPWISPLLGIRFEMFEDGLEICYPDGQPFKDPEAFALGEAQVQAKYAKSQVEMDQLQGEHDKLRAQLDAAIAQMRAAGLDFNGE